MRGAARILVSFGNSTFSVNTQGLRTREHILILSRTNSTLKQPNLTGHSTHFLPNLFNCTGFNTNFSPAFLKNAFLLEALIMASILLGEVL